MRQRLYKFIVVLLVLFSAQKNIAQNISSGSGTAGGASPLRPTAAIFTAKNPSPQPSSIRLSVLPGGQKDVLPVLQVPASDYYARNLAFFCRQELKVEKHLKVPVRLRMGSLEQCNRLEGKQ